MELTVVFVVHDLHGHASILTHLLNDAVKIQTPHEIVVDETFLSHLVVASL